MSNNMLERSFQPPLVVRQRLTPPQHRAQWAWCVWMHAMLLILPRSSVRLTCRNRGNVRKQRVATPFCPRPRVRSQRSAGPGVDRPSTSDQAPSMPLPRTPSLRLDGRRALVTGAGRGIGLAAAAALAQAGAHVACLRRALPPEIEAAAAELRTERRQCRGADARRHRPSPPSRAAIAAQPTLPHPGQQCRHQPPGAVPRGDRARLRRHHRR